MLSALRLDGDASCPSDRAAHVQATVRGHRPALSPRCLLNGETEWRSSHRHRTRQEQPPLCHVDGRGCPVDVWGQAVGWAWRVRQMGLGAQGGRVWLPEPCLPALDGADRTQAEAFASGGHAHPWAVPREDVPAPSGSWRGSGPFPVALGIDGGHEPRRQRLPEQGKAPWEQGPRRPIPDPQSHTGFRCVVLSTRPEAVCCGCGKKGRT